jgi:hypothetical protein
MHFQVVNPLILTLKIEVPTKEYAKSLAISLRQSTITRQASRQEASASRQIPPCECSGAGYSGRGLAQGNKQSYTPYDWRMCGLFSCLIETVANFMKTFYRAALGLLWAALAAQPLCAQ